MSSPYEAFQLLDEALKECQKGNLERVKEILEKEETRLETFCSLSDLKSDYERRMLIESIKSGHEHLCRYFLVNRRVSPHLHPMGSKKSAWRVCVETQNVRLCQLILEATTTTTTRLKSMEIMDVDGYSLLHRACESFGDNKFKIVKFLLDNGANPNTKTLFGGETPLLLACASRTDLNVVRILIEFGADPNFLLTEFGFPYSPISAALKRRDIPTSLFLIHKVGRSCFRRLQLFDVFAVIGFETRTMMKTIFMVELMVLLVAN